MSDLLAITFDGTDEAEAALRSIRAIEHEGRIQLEDSAVVRKDADGKVTIHNELASGTEAGIGIGAVLGGLLFVVFPVAAVVGGAVAGKRIFGSYPSLALNPDSGPEINPLDTGRGRFIPTTSCDQFFAELALWLGVSKANLPLIFPNIGNFYSTANSAPPIGFLLQEAD